MSLDDSKSVVLPAPVVAAFPPAPDELLAVISRLVTDEMLVEISGADCGMNVDENLAKLRVIRDTQAIPQPLEWEPREVLDLTRWTEPSDCAARPGAVDLPGHRMRAFACAVLLRAAADPANDGYFDGENSTLVALIESAIDLGGDLPRALARFLTWRIPRLEPCDERPLFLFGLLLLIALACDDVVPATALEDLSRLVETDEAAARAALGDFLPKHGDRWLFGLTFYDLKFDTWRLLAARVRNRFANRIGSKLLEIAHRIDGPA